MPKKLKELDLKVGHRRVGGFMHKNDIRVKQSRKCKVTSNGNHAVNIAPNLFNQNFSADKTNQTWAGDSSYVWTREGGLYLAVLVLKMAVAWLQPRKRCIRHADCSSQNCFHDDQKLLCKHGFWATMIGKGHCCEFKDGLRNNSDDQGYRLKLQKTAVETFFKKIKAE